MANNSPSKRRTTRHRTSNQSVKRGSLQLLRNSDLERPAARELGLGSAETRTNRKYGKLKTGKEKHKEPGQHGNEKDPTVDEDDVKKDDRKPKEKEEKREEKKEKEEKKELRGKKAPPHLKNGTLLNNRIRIERLMGGGGFGQVFKAVDTHHDNRVVAVKVEPSDKESGRMILEQHVLNQLRGTKHAPLLIASGSIDNFLYIVMEYLGRNLNDLRRRQPKRRFSPATVLRVCGQMLSALKAVHHIGYLHRDVKPSNMCVGYGDEQSRRNVFLVDFGMTRKFLTDHGERRKERQYAGFRGTMRYVSITVHERREQGPADDMWSLLYSMIEIGEGALPWRHIEDDEDMALKKKKTPIAEMIMHLPKDFKVMADYLSTLTYDSSPNYDFLIGVCKKALGPEITEESPYDWESQFVNSQSLEMDSE